MTSKKRRITLIALSLFTLLLLSFCQKPPLLKDVAFSRAVYDRNHELLRLTLSKDEKYRLFVPLSAISPLVIESTLLHEDQYFYTHTGINPAALIKAFYHTYLKGGRKIGASTVTMQLARIKYGIRSRTIAGKLQQIFYALRLELHYSKEELLEAYLNLVPYGRNIEGVGAASFIYFGKSAAELSLPEALTLSVIPQSPYRRSPGRGQEKDAILYKARNQLYEKWITEHKDDARQRAFFQLPLRVQSPADLPRVAPHFVNDMLASETGDLIITTLDMRMQKRMESLLSHYIQLGRPLGMANASALLVDLRNMEVVASVGSADFFDEERKGQINGVKSRRSPGSTLKPFIYALAFDQGLIHPMSLMKDSPHTYGDFNPENFDNDFLGPLSAHDALIKSRNVPALYLTSQLKNPTLYQWLVNAGIKKLKKEETYGLSLALGSAEVTMEELVKLYASLATNGIMHPLMKAKKEGDQAPVSGTKLFSPEAAFLTLDILKDTPPPRQNLMENTSFTLPIYWKTGTSNAYRDAWSVGVFGHYVLAVWVGDFRGKVRGSYVGITHAAPLFFSLSHAITERTHPVDSIASKAKDLHLTRVKACATTGDINHPLCTVQVPSWFIPGKSPIADSGILKKMLIDTKTGKPACRYVEGVTAYKTVEIWPSDILALYRKMGIHKENPPPSPCQNQQTASPHGLTITSPFKNVTYSVKLSAPSASQRIRFSAITNGASKELFWFVDNVFVGKATPGKELYWIPKPGSFSVRVVDDLGKADKRELKVLIAE